MNLMPIWEATYCIYNEMDAICRRHGLKMFAAYGTALGAVRHGGFIPWDDDFDVNMPRKDYEAFLKIAPQELPSWLKIVSYRNNANYHFLFPKVIICDADRLAKICEASSLPAPQGVFVDFFPIDGYPNSYLVKWMRVAVMGVTRFLLKITHSGRANALMDWFSALFDYVGAKRVVDWCGWYKQELKFLRRSGEKWPSAATFGAGKDIPFMNGKIRVPVDVNRYLSWVYGDYMRLPPETQRQPSHTCGAVGKASWRLG